MKKKPASERRNSHLFIRLTKEEKRKIESDAAEAESVSEYVRSKILTTT